MIISHTETIHEAHGIVGLDFATAIDALDKEGVKLAHLEADKTDAEDELKVVEARCYLAAEGKNIEEKKRNAMSSPDYLTAMQYHQQVRRQWLEARKRYAVLQMSIDIARSLLSYQKKQLEHIG